MKQLRLKETCTQYRVTRNRYGDVVMTKIGSLNCLFRNISQLMLNANREEVQIEGIFWFDSKSTVAMGDIIQFSGLNYRIEKFNRARERLTTNAVHFLKCEVSLVRQLS